MKYKTLSQVHTEAMNDHEYSAAFEAERSLGATSGNLSNMEKRSGFDVGTGCRTYGHQSAYYLTYGEERFANEYSDAGSVRQSLRC